MGILVAGLLLWTVVHMLPSVGRPIRTRIVAALGENPYKGIFSLLIVTAVVLMAVGWRGAVPTHVYMPPTWGRLAAFALMPIALMLFFAAHTPTNIKRVVRHPQLTGVVLWSIAHLLANGDSRSLVFFTGLASWAIVEMQLINHRDGAWVKLDGLTVKGDVLTVVIGAVVFAILIVAHPYVAGIRLIGL